LDEGSVFIRASVSVSAATGSSCWDDCAEGEAGFIIKEAKAKAKWWWTRLHRSSMQLRGASSIRSSVRPQGRSWWAGDAQKNLREGDRAGEAKAGCSGRFEQRLVLLKVIESIC